MASSRFDSLPEELFDSIISSLSTIDRLSLLRVSRKFRRIVEPRAYEDVVLDRRRTTGKFKRSIKKTPALAKRVTGLTVDATLQDVPEDCDRVDPPPDLWMTSKICHGLEYLDCLQELHLRVPYLDEIWTDNISWEGREANVLWKQHAEKLERTFAQATRVFKRSAERNLLPNLTSLSLYTQMFGYERGELTGLTIFFIPTLRNLEITNYDIDGRTTWGNGGYLYLDKEHRQSTALERLRLDNCRLSDATLSRIFECPRALKSLALTLSELASSQHDLFSWSPGAFVKALRPHQKSLESFEMFAGRTDGFGWEFKGTLDLSEMEALQTVTWLRHGAPPSKGEIVLGPRAKLSSVNVAPDGVD